MLDKCTNLFGPIGDEYIDRILDFFQYPNYDTWDDIAHIIISTVGLSNTIWQIIIDIDPTFPRSGRCEDLKGNKIKEWVRIPKPELVKKAIFLATH